MLNSDLLKLFSTYDNDVRGDSIMRTIRFNKEVFQNKEITESASELPALAEHNKDWILKDEDQGFKALNRTGYYKIISEAINITTTNLTTGKPYPTWRAQLLYCRGEGHKCYKTIGNVGPLINRKARFADLNDTKKFDKPMPKESFFKQLKGITFYISRQILVQDEWGDVKQTSWLILPDSLFLYNFRMSAPSVNLYDMLS